MNAEQRIAVGQQWRNRKTGRVVRITRYRADWDDAVYRWVEGSGGGPIYGCYLRRRYELIDPAATHEGDRHE